MQMLVDVDRVSHGEACEGRHAGAGLQNMIGLST